MRNITAEISKQLGEAAKRPTGSCFFVYLTEDDLCDPDKNGIIFDLVAGKHYFLIEKTNGNNISYYYASPGTDTRVATVNLGNLRPSKKAIFYFSWSPDEINLSVTLDNNSRKALSAKGEVSKKKYQITEDGDVVQIGDENVEVLSIRINTGNKQLVKPTAINAWNETKKAIDVLITGKSTEGYLFEVVKSNLSIVMLVTGFEAYTKGRFSELESEGIKPNIELVKKKLDNGTISFQDFNGDCKKAYKFGYNIKFSELVSSEELKKLKRLFKFRSRIVHASPFLYAINEFDIPKEKPIFSTNIVNESIVLFDKFINNLHELTLKLKRED